MEVFRTFSRRLNYCKRLDNLLRGVAKKTLLYTTCAAHTAVVSASESLLPGSPVGKISEAPSELVVKERKWTKVSRRTGLIAIKLGMTQMWNKEGTSHAVTVLQVL